MDSYADLSKIYDQWQESNDASHWADFVEKTLARFGKTKRGDGDKGSFLLLDAGCGTGSFAVEMANRGYDVLGIDRSEDMLAEARKKDPGQRIQFVCQDMTRMELFGTVDGIVCFLDTVNHVLDEVKLRRFFRLCQNYLNPGGLLIFDLATPYYFEEVLGSRIFYDINEDYTLIWQNAFDRKRSRSRSDLTYFIRREDGAYLRGEEQIAERAYTVQQILTFLQESRLTLLGQYGGLTFRKPSAVSQRILFVAENRGDEFKLALGKVRLEDRGNRF